MKITRRITPCERVPKWYGVVNHDLMTHTVLIALVPLNVVLRALYLIHGYAVYPFRRRTWWERREHMYFSKAQAGLRESRDRLERSMERRVRRECDRRIDMAIAYRDRRHNGTETREQQPAQ